MSKPSFTVTDSQWKRAEQWIEPRISHWGGSLGGQFVWQFMPTVMQTGVLLIDTATGDQLDLTEYESE